MATKELVDRAMRAFEAADRIGKAPKRAEQCECGTLLACGAYGGWWCPLHKDVYPAKYAVDAARELHGKYLAAADELYALKKRIGEA